MHDSEETTYTWNSDAIYYIKPQNLNKLIPLTHLELLKPSSSVQLPCYYQQQSPKLWVK